MDQWYFFLFFVWSLKKVRRRRDAVARAGCENRHTLCAHYVIEKSIVGDMIKKNIALFHVRNNARYLPI